MSVSLMSEVWAFEEADHYEMVVLLALADHVKEARDAEGNIIFPNGKVAFPGVRKLAKKSRMTPAGVCGVLDRVASKGWLKISKGGSPKGGKRAHNVYEITLPTVQRGSSDRSTGLNSTVQRGITVPCNGVEHNHKLNHKRSVNDSTSTGQTQDFAHAAGADAKPEKETGTSAESSLADRSDNSSIGTPERKTTTGAKASLAGRSDTLANNGTHSEQLEAPRWLSEYRNNPAYQDVNIDDELCKWRDSSTKKGYELTPANFAKWMKQAVEYRAKKEKRRAAKKQPGADAEITEDERKALIAQVEEWQQKLRSISPMSLDGLENHLRSSGADYELIQEILNRALGFMRSNQGATLKKEGNLYCGIDYQTK